MKASLKFREEHKKPLLRAKVPLSILGMPFQSGVVAGDSKELTLNLATFFESGPSLKLAYRPNDSNNPFSLVVKTGTGPFGSPSSSSMLMSCEFNLLPRNNSGGPLFMLHFKPRFGDFSFKKTQSSIFDKKVSGSRNGVGAGGFEDDVVSVDMVDKVPIFGNDSPAAGAFSSLFSGTEVAARTTLPLRGKVAVNFRWGIRVPAEMKSSAFQKIPFLVMDKVSVEHMMDCGDSKKEKGVAGKGSDLGFPAGSDVAEACFAVKRQMEVLQAENGLLRNAVEDLRREMAGGGGSEMQKWNGGIGKNPNVRKNEKNKTTSDFNVFSGKSTEGDASEELKKALKGATTNGA
ncbi:uncharacterized protein LOC133307908 [Gastrolobium bilobum]|uniref:uncharacterized protein LOC133307908 n=1 Tax=Gastrolobium bilobum TaxID=150636 RepID=UPI002AB2E7F0|nr:uncharacterized protein LOC133307908 [Gastrolobium bilobum]